jgi:hypothetical protein
LKLPGRGASNLVFDASRLGAVGGTTRLSAPGWDAARDGAILTG